MPVAKREIILLLVVGIANKQIIKRSGLFFLVLKTKLTGSKAVNIPCILLQAT
jgi:hypothetical protein